MALQKAVDTQRDFSAGELDASAKRRDDDEFVKKGMRQLSNARLLNTGGVTQRPGRNLLASFTTAGRAEDFLIAPGVKYRIVFTTNTVTIYDSTGTQVFTLGGQPWTAATVDTIVYAIYLRQIFITYPGMQPLVLTWDGAAAWSSANYAETVTAAGQKRTPFYRFADSGMTLLPSALSGNVTLTTSANYFVNGMIGTRVRYTDRQILITGVTNPTTADATIEENLPEGMTMNFGSDPRGSFFAGEIVTGATSGAKGYVIGTAVGSMTVQLGHFAGITRTIAFVVGETVIGPNGSLANTNVGALGPQAIPLWDEELMNSYRGWPAACFVDQNRLGLCDFPALPSAIAWSAIGLVTDLYVGADPSDAMLELAPGKSQVLHVVPGPESSEFVFCDNAVYYIPITPANPLKPGSVQFQKISSDGAAGVQPRTVGGTIFYADQGRIQVQVIVATGAYNRPFESKTLTDLHSHLFNAIVAIALPTSVTQFPERYAYVLNGDGTVAVGKYVLDERGNIGGRVGWLPWNGSGTVKWISALNDVVLMQTDYTSGGNTAHMLEQLDATLYLDASLPVNAIPSTLTPPGGKGPLWWLPGATVDLMDGRLPLGPHTTDADGFLVPIFPGEDLTSATLRAGFTWTGIWEPFVLTSQGSQGADERMKKRRIARLQAYVMQSSGFLFAKFYSGEVGPNLPATGAIVSSRRIAAYNQDDDANQAPPLREKSYAYKPLGRAHDPRAGIIKDTPGPLTLVEMAAKASI